MWKESVRRRCPRPLPVCACAVTLITLLSGANGCGNDVSTPGRSQDTEQARLDSLSLASLRRISDAPFYTMRWYGPTGYEEYAPGGTNVSGIDQSPSSPASAGPAREAARHWACTCFAAPGHTSAMVFGRNFDWYHTVPLLLLTDPPDAYATMAMVDIQYLGYGISDLPDDEENRNGLLGVTAIPFDGMNEMGLVVGMNAVPHAEPPIRSGRPRIWDLEMMRIILDHAADVDEAITLFGRFTIDMDTVPIHFLVADAGGRAAVIEFLNQEMKVIRSTGPWQITTNFIISGSGAPDVVTCWRYATVRDALRESGGVLTVTGALDLLQAVSEAHTEWSAVYGLQEGVARVAIGRDFSAAFTFTLPPE